VITALSHHAPDLLPRRETQPSSTRAIRAGRRPYPRTFDDVYDLLADARSRLARVSARAAYQEALYGRAVLVDIRPQAQREQEGQVHADLAPVLIERNVLEWRLDPRHPASLPIADLGLRVILICQEGYASSLAADLLQRLGIHRSTDLIGGFAAWRAAGLPLALEPRPAGVHPADRANRPSGVRMEP
jgi:rhodanese-related sulfurtransferase